MLWTLYGGRRVTDLGLLPTFLRTTDPSDARTQIHYNYLHGGGWVSIPGFTFNPKTYELLYPGDPPLKPWARATLRSETIYVYDFSFVLVLQGDGSYDVARID